MGGLFQLGRFKFSSGIESPFKLECDELSLEECEALAFMGAHQVCRFGKIVPVPKGKSGSPIDNAKRLADALERYIKPDSGVVLIVDDVCTSGGSMEACRKEYRNERHNWPCVIGWVAFAYGPMTVETAAWVTPFMTMSPTFGVFPQPGAR